MNNHQLQQQQQQQPQQWGEIGAALLQLAIHISFFATVIFIGMDVSFVASDIGKTYANTFIAISMIIEVCIDRTYKDSKKLAGIWIINGLEWCMKQSDFTQQKGFWPIGYFFIWFFFFCCWAVASLIITNVSWPLFRLSVACNAHLGAAHYVKKECPVFFPVPPPADSWSPTEYLIKQIGFEMSAIMIMTVHALEEIMTHTMHKMTRWA